MFRALQNVVPSHLADSALFDFSNLKLGTVPDGGGDIAFDKEAFQATGSISILDSRPKEPVRGE